MKLSRRYLEVILMNDGNDLLQGISVEVYINRRDNEDKSTLIAYGFDPDDYRDPTTDIWLDAYELEFADRCLPD